MPRACTVCVHGEREAIDSAAVSGTPYRRIAAQFGLSATAVRRHADDHLPAHLAKAEQAAEIASADDLLAQVRTLHSKALSILATAEAGGDLRAALMAIAQARSTLELLAKLLGELSDAPQINLLVSPEWLSLRATILTALSPYPEARQAVAGRLAALPTPR